MNKLSRRKKSKIKQSEDFIEENGELKGSEEIKKSVESEDSEENEENEESSKNKKPLKLNILLGYLILYRIINAIFTKTYFNPDEYWQSVEVGHYIVFGYPKLLLF